MTVHHRSRLSKRQSPEHPTRGIGTLNLSKTDRKSGQPTAYDGLVLAEQVKQLYSIAPISWVATFINSLIVFFILKDAIGYAVMAPWLTGVWMIGGLRIALFIWFRSAPLQPDTAASWQRRYLVTLVLAGMAWGSIGLFPFSDLSLVHQVFLMFVLGGMSAGASAAFSVVRHGFTAFSIPALVPAFIQILLLDDIIHYAMASMFLLFGGLIWLISRHNFSLNKTSLMLRFENLDVIARLKASKAQLVSEVEAKLKAEAELKRYQEHLERIVEERTADLSTANKELEQFAYVASHDLKAPLRAIANLALAVDEDASQDLDPENRERLKMLRDRARRMDALIEGMLAYARVGQPTAGSAHVALADVLSEIKAEIPLPPGFTVEWENPLPSLQVHPIHLRQIFQNLIGNAIQHHDRPAGQVWVRAWESREHWHLEVADDGPGIPAGERQKVFRMFDTSSKKDGHTGIGLAVVRKLVLGYGGEIEAVANRPRGTIFRITWPKRFERFARRQSTS